MTAATSLIPGLNEIVRHGNAQRRAEAARRIAELFFEDAADLKPNQIELFDGILVDVVPHAQFPVRVDLAERLSLLAKGPRALVDQLSRENEILVAGPLLRRSPLLDESALIEIASAKGQGHLLAMSERALLSADVTDVLVRRGDRDVVRRAAGNSGAAFSENGYSALIKRAGKDGVLTLKVGQRDDLSGEQLKALLEGSMDVLRRRLLEVVKPGRQAAIRQAMNEISGITEPVDASHRNFVPAQRALLALHHSGGLNEGALLGFAKTYKYEEAVAALSAMSGVQIATLDRLFSGDRHDPILVVGKKIGLEWATVRALILLRLGPNRVLSPADIEAARQNFSRLMPSTAERVVNFWQTRQSA